jgi:hypothetical protein
MLFAKPLLSSFQPYYFLWVVAVLLVSSPGPAIAGDFSPKDLPGLCLWLRSDLGISTEAGRVVEWKDQSGKHFHATADLDNAPILEEAERLEDRNLPAVRFVGRNQFLSSSRGLDINLSDGFTVVAVFRASNPRNFSGILYLLPSDHENLVHPLKREDACLVAFTGRPNNVGVELYHQPTHEVGETLEGGSYAYGYIETGEDFTGAVTFSRSAREVRCFLNEEATQVFPFRMAATGTQNSGFRIGASLVGNQAGTGSVPGRFANFDLFELIVVDRDLSESEILSLHRYLKAPNR